MVTFDGIPAPLVFADAGITAAIVPYAVAGQSSTQVVVTYQGVASPPMKLSVGLLPQDYFQPTAPGPEMERF